MSAFITLKDFLGSISTLLNAEVINNLSKIFKEEKFFDDSSKKTLFERRLDSAKLRIIIDITLIHLEQSLSKEKFAEVILTLIKYFLIKGQNKYAFNLTNLLLGKAQDNKRIANYYGYGLLSIAEIYRRQALWKEGIENLSKAKKLFIDTKDNSGIARCENLIGSILAEQGSIKKGQSHFRKGLELIDSKNQFVGGLIHNNLGITYSITGELEQALSYFKRALLVFEKYKNTNYIADVRHNLGMIYLKKEHYKNAIKEFDKSINAARSIDYSNLLAISYLSKSYLFTLTNDLTLAEEWLEKSLELATEHNDNLTIADCYKVKGIIFRKTKKYIAGEQYLIRSIKLNSEYNNELNLAESCFEMGILLKEKNDVEGAKKYFNNALQYYKKIDSKIDTERIISYL